MTRSADNAAILHLRQPSTPTNPAIVATTVVASATGPAAPAPAGARASSAAPSDEVHEAAAADGEAAAYSLAFCAKNCHSGLQCG